MWAPGSAIAMSQECTVYHNPLYRSRVSRIAWLWFRHPVKSREFPARAERLITADELLRYGV
jgi:hypothetical protein